MAAAKKSMINLQHAKSLAFLKSLTLFNNLTDDAIALFADLSQVKSYKKGDILYMDGQPAKHFYIILNGWLKLFHLTADGEEISLAVMTRDSITGENALFEQGFYKCNAQIVEDAQILHIPLKLLKEQIRTNQQIAFNMLTSMVQHRRHHEHQFEQHLLYSAPQRIGCFLLGLFSSYAYKII